MEVADTSLAYDRETKFPLYAGAGILEAWLTDLDTERFEVHSEPGSEGFRKAVRFARGERVKSVAFPRLAFAADEAMPSKETK